MTTPETVILKSRPSGLVAIIGRPNVGKSTLFNRLTRSKTAIVAGEPGTTRDRLYGNVYFDASHEAGFTLVDTGGFETKGFCYQPFKENLVWRQTELAIDEADVVILLLDNETGVHEFDRHLARHLQKLNKNVLYVVNKVDGKEHTNESWEFYALGVDTDVIPISARSKFGIPNLMSEIEDRLGKVKPARKAVVSERSLAIVGRPNAGKSSILNRLLGCERSIVSDVAGTTRDSIESDLRFNSVNYSIVDTAGIRRKTRVDGLIEARSVFQSIRAIETALVVIYVIDALEGMTDQDARLLNLAKDRHKPVLLIINKWDLVPNKTANSARDYERNLRLIFTQGPIHFISCTENQRVHKIMPWVEQLFAELTKRVTTARVNEVLGRLTDVHAHHSVGNRSVKFFYATQLEVAPPTFVIMCNQAKLVTKAYQRYLIKGLCKELGFQQVPIRLILRNKSKNGKDGSSAAKTRTAAPQPSQAASSRHALN